MADFSIVHRRGLANVRRSLDGQRGGVWNMIVEEPMQFDQPMSETAFFVTLAIGADNKLHPANEGSLKVIQDWKERHKETPNEAFEFPKGILSDVGGSSK